MIARYRLQSTPEELAALMKSMNLIEAAHSISGAIKTFHRLGYYVVAIPILELKETVGDVYDISFVKSEGKRSKRIMEQHLIEYFLEKRPSAHLVERN